jgi:hypothetical protein
MFDMANPTQRMQNSSSFRHSDVNKTLGVEDTSNDESFSGSQQEISDDDKVLAESKRFMNYLKAVKNIVPKYGQNENTNKLIGLMEELKKSDTNGISKYIEQIQHSERGHSREIGKDQQNQYVFKTPELHDRYKSQRVSGDDKFDRYKLEKEREIEQKEATFKKRQAYNSIMNKLDDYPSASEEDLSNLKSEELRQLLKNSQK